MSTIARDYFYDVFFAAGFVLYLQGRRAELSGNPVPVKLFLFTLRLEYKVHGDRAVAFKQEVQRESLLLKANADWIVNEAVINAARSKGSPLGASGQTQNYLRLAQIDLQLACELVLFFFAEV